jgi:hypothetical protein
MVGLKQVLTLRPSLEAMVQFLVESVLMKSWSSKSDTDDYLPSGMSLFFPIKIYPSFS